eukprot:TRINITY_DN25379_c0_g1_i4.p1 TRINITY_DN25379_c0_g1~~TRINITY_DN25379_c0_g1_i4.p1  ORF type:complete len:260 (+),score=34.46 TRINITY_DN25379_c0_g1_i4:95-781(+)
MHAVSAGSDWSIRELKDALHKQMDTHPDDQRLILEGVELRNSQLLAAAISDCSETVELTMVRKPEGHAEWLRKLRKDGLVLAQAPCEIRGDVECVLAAVESNGAALKFATEDLKEDRDFISDAIRKNAGSLAYASIDLRSNREFILVQVRHNGCALAGATDELKFDPDVVLAAVKENHHALAHASSFLKRELGFMMAAVKANRDSFDYADWKLQGNQTLKDTWRSRRC